MRSNEVILISFSALTLVVSIGEGNYNTKINPMIY